MKSSLSPFHVSRTSGFGRVGDVVGSWLSEVVVDVDLSLTLRCIVLHSII